jgi:hypothetical protein
MFLWIVGVFFATAYSYLIQIPAIQNAAKEKKRSAYLEGKLKTTVTIDKLK